MHEDPINTPKGKKTPRPRQTFWVLGVGGNFLAAVTSSMTSSQGVAHTRTIEATKYYHDTTNQLL